MITMKAIYGHVLCNYMTCLITCIMFFFLAAGSKVIKTGSVGASIKPGGTYSLSLSIKVLMGHYLYCIVYSIIYFYVMCIFYVCATFWSINMYIFLISFITALIAHQI